MIDERAFINFLQESSELIGKRYKGKEADRVINVINTFIDILEDFPKIEFHAYGSENYNSEETQVVKGDW